MKKIIIILLSLLSLQGYAQKQAWHWYFGIGAGLDFSQTRSVTVPWGVLDGVPASVSGPVNTMEGCFSISDKDGNFLFASDGMTVYNKNLATMQNGTGLLGNSSATSSGIIIPFPGSPNLFYLVTAAAMDGARNGLRYSVVDLSLNGGLGAVTTKNTVLSLGVSGYTAADVYENVTVVGHANGIDFWLVSRIRAKYLVWKISAAGISAPQIYSVGVDLGLHPWTAGAGVGVLKLSPDGKKLVHCDFGRGYLTVSDFNTETGDITNVNSIATGVSRLYGVEFSPSGEYLYITVAQNVAAHNGLYIRKIDNLNPPYVGTRILPNVSNVQMGPDNRIYGISQYVRTSLWVIDNPDEGGTRIAELPNVFSGTRLPWLGLPVFITSFFSIKPIVTKAFYCIGNPAEYSVEIPNIGSGQQKIDHLVWDFGDGTPTVIDNSINVSKTVYTQTHTYDVGGKYTITVTPYLISGLPDNSKRTVIQTTVLECKIVTNKMIRHDILPQ